MGSPEARSTSSSVRIRVSGATELVRCVGDKASLSADGAVEPIERFVHRVSETVDLVTGVGFSDSSSQIGAADLRQLDPHLLDRSQCSTGEPPGERTKQ